MPDTAFSTGTTAWRARPSVTASNGLLERGAGHEARVAAEQLLRRFFAVGARRALIRGVGDRLVEVDWSIGADRLGSGTRVD